MASVLASDRLNFCQILQAVPLVEARVPQSGPLGVKGSGPRRLAFQYLGRYYLRLAGYTCTQVAGALGHPERSMRLHFATLRGGMPRCSVGRN